MKKSIIKFIPLCIMASFLVTGCAEQGTKSSTTAAKPAATAKAQGTKYAGKIKGKSNKAKSITIVVGKGKDAKSVMVKFDDKTKGVEHAAVGHASIIFYEMRDGAPYATVIKPKLAKLPEGVKEIKTDEMVELVESGTAFTLIDARPAKRYAEGHMPGAISIGVKEYKAKTALLPKDKNQTLVMYCGGPT